jgi:hypothetical protein
MNSNRLRHLHVEELKDITAAAPWVACVYY